MGGTHGSGAETLKLVDTSVQECRVPLFAHVFEKQKDTCN